MDVVGEISALHDLKYKRVLGKGGKPRKRVALFGQGAMAGIIGAERAHAFADANIPADHFDVLIGTSAGAYTKAAYSAGQADLTPSAYLHLACIPFLPWDPLKLGYLHQLLRGKVFRDFGLDISALRSCETEQLVGVSDMKGRFKLHSLKESADPFRLLWASSAIWPFTSGYEIDGVFSVDGGFAHPCPIKKVIRDLGDPDTEFDFIFISNTPRPEFMHWFESFATWAYAQFFFAFHPEMRESTSRGIDKMARAVRMFEKKRKRHRLCGLFPKPENAVSMIENRYWVLRYEGKVAYETTMEVLA